MKAFKFRCSFTDLRTIVILVLRMGVPNARYRPALVFATMLSSVAVAGAHDLEATVSLAPPAVVIRAVYGGSEPVPFAKVQVFGPSAPAQEFQTGLTDRRGYFSFVPEGAGAWKVIVDDEEGHRREISVTVPEPFKAKSDSAPASNSRLERALLGIALIIGATGFLYGFKARRSAGRLPS
jgi:nickel transport protein